MGIPYYVASLLRTHKNIQKQVGNAPLEVDVLGIDFNCFIHTYLDPKNPIGSIVLALNKLLTETVRATDVYIAFDGLVPYSKIVQQRYRRFRIPDGPAPFDKHQISPGTPFMTELKTTLELIFPNVILSGTDEPGEGEHKIFQWLRRMEESADRARICIYGLDADLVLIAVAQRSLGHIQLLREDKDGGFNTFSIPELVKALPLDPDLYVQMCIMCFGNDFMPNLAMFSLREEGYNRAIRYMQMQDLTLAAKDETPLLIKRAKAEDRRIVATDGHALETRFGVNQMDGILDWEPVVYAFWKTFEWTLHYFKTSEVLDWCWYYPYPDAPLVKTLVEYPRYAGTDFAWPDWKAPYTIADQLSFILPSESLSMTPVRPRYTDEMYDEELETRHPWMKRYKWECDPYISLPWDPARPLTSVSAVRVR